LDLSLPLVGLILAPVIINLLSLDHLLVLLQHPLNLLRLRLPLHAPLDHVVLLLLIELHLLMLILRLLLLVLDSLLLKCELVLLTGSADFELMLIASGLGLLPFLHVLLRHDGHTVFVLLVHDNALFLDLALLLHEHHLSLSSELLLLFLFLLLLPQGQLLSLDLFLLLSLGTFNFVEVHLLLALLLLQRLLLGLYLHLVLLLHPALLGIEALGRDMLGLLALALLLHLELSLISLANGLHLDFIFQHLLHLLLLLPPHLLQSLLLHLENRNLLSSHSGHLRPPSPRHPRGLL